MKCPFCGGEMRKGVLNGDGRSMVKFMPEGEKPGLFYNGKRLLNVKYNLTRFEIKADYCEKCGKMFFDTKI